MGENPKDADEIAVAIMKMYEDKAKIKGQKR